MENKQAQKFNDRQDAIDRMIARTCTMPVVTSVEEARKVWDGLKKLTDFKPDELEEIKNLTLEEVGKRWKSGDVTAAISIVGKSLSLVGDAMKGTAYDEYAIKTLHADGTRDGMPLLFASGLEVMSADRLDNRWVQAFSAVDATGYEKIKVADFVNLTRVIQYKRSSEDLEVSGLGSDSDDELGRRYFGGAHEYSTREQRFSMWSVNNILTNLRVAAIRSIGVHAYREIARMNAGVTQEFGDAGVYTGGSTAREILLNDIFDARHNLNQTHFKMVNRAAKTEGLDAPNLHLKEAPLDVNAQTPILFYYNHKHFEFIDLMQRMTGGDDNINMPMLKNWVFVETNMFPESGGHTITGEEGTDRDLWGFFGQAAEYKPVNTVGGMAIIPGQRNLHATFRNPEIVSATAPMKEVVKVGIKLENNFFLDGRQKAYVVLKAQ